MNHKNTNKSKLYIICFSVIILLIIALYVISQNDKSAGTPTADGNVAAKNETVINQKPDETKGSPDETIQADISFRDVDFSLTEDDILNKEEKSDETLDDPSIAKSQDGYTYITYKSNPETPLNYNGFTVSGDINSCLTYVLKNNKLDEVRLQFGLVDDTTYSGILNNIISQYGESSFYRSSGTAETYWWKTDKNSLMLNHDGNGTTIFFRMN